MLTIDNLTVRFGGITAVDRVSMVMAARGVTAIIGPNGAGKTTLFNAVNGLISSDEGEIRLEKRQIDRLRPSQIARVGVARTLQSPPVYKELRVLDVAKIGCHVVGKCSFYSSALHTGRYRRYESEITQKAMHVLGVLGLERKAKEYVSSLSYGEVKKLDIARAIVSDPKLLLMDEPAAGLNNAEKKDLEGIIESLRDTGIGICLIEHDMKLVLSVADRIIVMADGRKLAEGVPSEVINDTRVVEVYLGNADW